jgi:hypothetical protein
MVTPESAHASRPEAHPDAAVRQEGAPPRREPDRFARPRRVRKRFDTLGDGVIRNQDADFEGVGRSPAARSGPGLLGLVTAPALYAQAPWDLTTGTRRRPC